MELLVAMAIGLVVTLAITSTVVVGEGHNRTTTSTNDMSQTGAYAAYILDRALRNAGSGFAQSWNLGVFGCRLSAAHNGTTILPRSTAFPAPFAGLLGGAGAALSGNLRVAPLLIAKNQSSAGSDILVVMGGGAVAGDVARLIRSPGAIPNTSLRLDNTIDLSSSDIVLVSQSGAPDCLVEEVAPFTQVSGNQVLPLGGTAYYLANGPTTSLSTFSNNATGQIVDIGNASVNSAQFQMFGVGDNQTLFDYDLLQGDGTDAPQAIADGVAELHAVYGLDTNLDGILDTWVDPGATGYDIATVMTTPATLRQIVAVRIALVLRSSNYEKAIVSPPTLTLFSELPAAVQQTVNLSANDQHYRYRVVESTIPLRNMLLAP